MRKLIIGGCFYNPFVFLTYSLTTKREYCIIKERKRAFLAYGIFLSHFFICISARGLADLLHYTAQREEPCAFSPQHFVLCVGRAHLRAFNACIFDARVFFRAAYWNIPQGKAKARKAIYRAFGMRQPILFVLFQIL